MFAAIQADLNVLKAYLFMTRKLFYSVRKENQKFSARFIRHQAMISSWQESQIFRRLLLKQLTLLHCPRSLLTVAVREILQMTAMILQALPMLYAAVLKMYFQIRVQKEEFLLHWAYLQLSNLKEQFSF